MIKAIIFDFDGVLVNSIKFHIKKIKELFGIKLTEQEFRQIHTGNFFDSKAKNLSGLDWEKYRDFIYRDQSMHILDDKIKEILRMLHKDYMLFIVSSGGTRNIADFLRNNNALGFFNEVLGLESSRSKEEKFKMIFAKYSLTPDECVFITDTLGDIIEANNAGIRTIAVSFGFHDRKTLEKGNPVAVVDDFDALYNLLLVMS